MDQSKKTKIGLPSTSRLSGKIMEYCRQYAGERDLEKFMRLYSPANSQEIQITTQVNDKSIQINSELKSNENIGKMSPAHSCISFAMATARPLSACGVASSKSLPNIDIHDIGSLLSNSVTNKNIQAEEEIDKVSSHSAENLVTPKKSFRNIKTQTPESVAKTHRRLEWDSLGDVGYKKSMSASNISTMERTLLKELFKENSGSEMPNTDTKEHHEAGIHKTEDKSKSVEIEYSTPPLASSTLVVRTKSGTKPKMVSQSTSSTSLHEKFEKYVQTSLIKAPTVRSQEIQCTMSSSNSIEGTATPSSFEYYSSRSSKSSNCHINTKTQKHLKPMNHPFITSITDLLIKKKVLGERSKETRHQLNNICELQSRIQADFDENKENQSQSTLDSSRLSSFSLSKQAPELDLGIQLICSLINAKSINERQKKKLIHDIIKRIMQLGAEDQTTNSSTTHSSTTSNDVYQHRNHVYDSVRAKINNKNKHELMAKFKEPQESVLLAPGRENPTDKNSLSSIKVINEPKKCVVSRPLKDSEPQIIQKGGHKVNNSKQITCDINQHFSKNINLNKENGAEATVSQKTQSELSINERSRNESDQTSANSNFNFKTVPAKPSKTSNENRINRCTQTSKTSSSATTTPDLITQRFIAPTNEDLNNSNTDAEQPTMREWLNPLTQSEIEYEEKKQNTAKQQKRLMKKMKHDCGRVQQISWIDNEINRLECLKHLLLKDESTGGSSTSLSNLQQSVKKDFNKGPLQTNKLYDSVCSEKSLVVSESAEQLVQEIEIILEESHENVINLKDNTKRTKERKKETQIMYGMEEKTLHENVKKTKPKFRMVDENINFHEEQILTDKRTEISSKKREQRGKIDTPTTDKSQESGSLKDLVQQRKREFMEAYTSKKQHHYEVLKQQKEEFRYLNTQSKLSQKAATNTDSEHYSVPRTSTTKYTSHNVPYYSHIHLPMQTSVKDVKLKSQEIQRERTQNNSATDTEQRSAKPIIREAMNTTSTNTNNTITTSSSSMFCLSSDVSVPMGSQNSSSTPTTTHQYDDVATAAAAAVPIATVSVQTSDSILRSNPIYGPKQSSTTLIPPKVSTTACIQVKPKGIAYVIEFDDKKQTLASESSNIAMNSNDAKSNLTHNLKSSSSTGPLLTLQEHLEQRKPMFLRHSKKRKAILNQLQAMRQERARQLREIIENTSLNSIDRRLRHLPPPPTQKLRILKTKEMKALTNKRFVSLPEVLAKQEREIEERERRGNRILKDVFNRRLQKRVRSGKLSLNHSKTVI